MSIDTMITARDVANMLMLDTSTVYRLTNKPGGIPAYKIGGSIRYRPDEVEAYIKNQTIKPPTKKENVNTMKRFRYVPGMKVVSA